MKLILPVLSLLWAAQTFAQMPLDSTYKETEIEDSLSALFIKPIQNPEKLLKRTIERLKLDLQQKHEVQKFQVGAIFTQVTLTPFAAGYTFSAKAGVGLEKIKLDKFSYEGPYELALADSAQIRSYLIQFATLSPVHAHKAYWESYKAMSPLVNFKETIKCYDVKADSIGDASGRCLLRFRFTWKVKQRKDFDWNHYNGNISGIAYFDSQTLRLTQFKGSAFMPSLQYITRLQYQIEYEEKVRTPVVKQINMIGAKDDMIMKATVRRSP